MKPIPYRDHLILPADPRLLTLIPHAKQLVHEGRPVMLVPHKVDETAVLRNLGYEVSPPVLLNYDWCGSSPFDTQRITTALITTHKRCYVLNGIGCVDADTEVLTPTGWVRIADWAGQAVAQYWPDTAAIDFVQDPEYVKLPCTEMLRIKTKYGIDQLVSPEHRCLLTNGARHETVEARELFRRGEQWQATGKNRKATGRIGFSAARIPTTFQLGTRQPGIALTDEQVRVQVMFHADGSVRRDTTDKGVINVKKDRKKLRVRALLTAAGIPWVERDKRLSGEGYTEFRFAPPALTKVFGRDWWACSQAQLEVVASEALHWDGSVTHGKRWSSRSAACADFVQYAFAAAGFTARLTPVPRGEKIDYTVQIHDRQEVGIRGIRKDGRHHNMRWEPSTDGFKYCFMVPSTYLLFRRNGCIFASGNTGKTRALLFAYDYLKRTRAVGRMVVTAPLSTLRQTWAKEIMMIFPHLTCEVLHGTKAKRLKALGREADIYIINHDGLAVIEQELLARTDITMLGLDELSVYKNPKTDLWKVANRVAQRCDRVVGLTATPMPTAPTDAFGQLKMITPHTCGYSFSRFREETMIKVSQFIWIKRDNAVELVHKKMQPSVRFTRDDCYDLPPCQTITVEAALSPEQKDLYTKVAAECAASIAQGEVKAVNEADRINKLTQIALGTVYDVNRKVIELDCRPRLALLDSLVEQSNSKVIVFTPYKSSLAKLHAHLSQRWTVEAISGDVSATAREHIFTRFMNTPDPHIIVAHPATMSHGLTLTEASTIVWYGPPLSLEMYEQANGRITRAGQRHAQLVAQIAGTKLEQRIYSRLQARADTQGLLLDMFEAQELADLL